MTASILFVRMVVAELQRRQVPARTLLNDVCISEGELSDMCARIRTEQLDALIGRALTLAGDPGLGLAIGRHAPSSALQVLSYLMLSSRTLRLAFEAYLQHAPALATNLSWKLRENQELAVFSLEHSSYTQDTARVIADAALTMGTRLLRLFGQQGPREVWFHHARPAYVRDIEAIFHCPLRFQQPCSALVFERRLLDLPQLHADQGAVSLLRDATARLFEPPAGCHDVTERVRLLLRDGELSAPSLERIARRLGMSRRTLRRRLAEEGVTLTALVDEARCMVACEALRHPRPRIRETSRRLGFSEPSAFHRAFKRWTGKTPLEFSRDPVAPDQLRPSKPCAAAG